MHHADQIEEIVRGLRPSEVDVASGLFGGLDILPIRECDGWRAGQWRGEFAARGVTLWQADCLIAGDEVEATHQWWVDAGKPALDAWRVSVTPTGQSVELDAPVPAHGAGGS